MKTETAEWIAKAEADWLTAGVVFRARKAPNFDAACFFSQQFAEKYLKARLVEAGVQFRRTHDLIALVDLCAPFEPTWSMLRPALADLTEYAVAFRYPGKSADRARAKKALADAETVRQYVRRSFRLNERVAGKRSGRRSNRPSSRRKPK